MSIRGSIADGEGGNYLIAVGQIATVSIMNTIPFYRRNALWLLVVAVILVAWAIDRSQLSYRHMRAEIALLQAENQAAGAKMRVEAQTYAQTIHERNRRAAMGIAE